MTKAAPHKPIWCLDLGIETGWALLIGDKITSGTACFKTTRFDGGGVRFLRFREWLDALAARFGVPDVVYYETVRRHLGVDAAHCYGGFLAKLTSWCERNTIAYSGIPVGTWKKAVTRNGTANKRDVINEVRKRGHLPIDDNEADAIAIAYYIREGHHVKAPFG